MCTCVNFLLCGLPVWGTDSGKFLWAKWASKSNEKPALHCRHHGEDEGDCPSPAVLSGSQEAGPGGTALAQCLWAPARTAFKSSVFTPLQSK